MAWCPTLQTSLVKPAKEGSKDRPRASGHRGKGDTGFRNLKTNSQGRKRLPLVAEPGRTSPPPVQG